MRDKYNMDNNLDKIALDLYGKIQTRFPDIKIGDENAAVLSSKSDIPNARFFEFEYSEHGEPLGTIAITLDIDDGIVVQVSGDLVDDDNETTHHSAYKFIRSFRQFAKNRLLNFDVQNIGKSNLDKRDYQFQAKPKELTMMESKMFGTSRISYQDLGEARLIVKHSQPVNTELPAGRTMHIQSIYIENIEGERFKYPFKHLHGARALAEHIKHGGNPYDEIGRHITSLSEELNQLRKFKGYVGRQAQISEAMGSVTNRAIERIEEVKKEIHNLQRPAYYAQFAESFTAREEKQIPEEVMNDWIDRLTVRTFNEELKGVFPYLYNIVDESELPICELDADYFLSEKAPKGWEGTVKAMKKHPEIDNPWALAHSMKNKGYKSHKKESVDPEIAFESFINRIMLEDKDEIFSPNADARNAAIQKLNDILQNELRGGPDGVNAVQSLTGLIDDQDFFDSIRDIDPDLDIRPLIQQYVTDRDPKVASLLTYGDGNLGGANLEPSAPGAELGTPPAPPAADAGAPAPMPPPADLGAPPAPMPPPADLGAPPAPMPPPMQEGTHHKKSKIKAKFIKAKAAGATLETQFAEGMTILDAMIEMGIDPAECGYMEDQPVDTQLSGVDQILKSIAGFWNKEERNFTIGGTRAKTKVEKGFKDGEYPNASEEDVRHVMQLIDSMDPSEGQQQQTDVLRLAGVQQPDPDQDQRHAKLSGMLDELQSMSEAMDFLDKAKKRKTIRNNHEKNYRKRASVLR